MASAGGLDGLGQRLDEDDVVVHGVDPFIGVRWKTQEMSKLAVLEVDHDGQGALPMQGRPCRDDCRVLGAAIERLGTGDAQRGLQGEAVGLFHLRHGDAQGAHLVVAHVIEPQVER